MNGIERELRALAQAEREQEGQPGELPAAVRAAIPAGARSARLKAAQRRAERRQTRMFALALAAAALLAAAGIIAWHRGAALEGIWMIPAAGVGLMLLLAPVMGYFSEEESKYDA
ncbi:MAG: hypothetical protein ACI4L8_10090 [Candidatus Fimadaptatus sp.]